MRFVDIIEKKKQNIILTEREIDFFIQEYVADQLADYQVSALLMAIYFNGMNDEETYYLTKAMLNSGKQIDVSSIDGIVCDKHSTGGVGDKTSLVLAPMVAACGVHIAKMSGRGLGHTGGTLDKLESIEGFSTQLNPEQFVQQINDIHLAIVGQSSDIVPADKKLYALRDVTATVDSIPLIASSIMSKKLASGAEAIMLDVKYGEGAFMQTAEDAKTLAEAMIRIGKLMKRDVKAVITNMNQPLGNAIGNALEVSEAIATLRGEGPEDLVALCLQLGSIMLIQANKARDEDEARTKLLEVLHSGDALKAFARMVEAQGGNIHQVYHPETLPKAKKITPILSIQKGYIHFIHAQQLGGLAMQIGAGRAVKEDIIDYAVGIVLNKKCGDYVELNEPLAYIHLNHELPNGWLEAFYASFEIHEQMYENKPLIHSLCI